METNPMTDTEELAEEIALAAMNKCAEMNWTTPSTPYAKVTHWQHPEARKYWLAQTADILPILTRREADARAAGAAQMQERCAGVAESYEPMWPGKGATIATAIRSLTC